MSKTYNLTATLNTGKNSALNDGNWSGYASTNVSSSEVGSIGRTSGPLFYATNMVFDSATLNTLRNKTINGVTLTLVITQGTDAPAIVAWKYNSTSSGNTNSQAWARSNNSGTLSAGDASIATNANPSFAAGEVTTGTKTLALKGLPQYGLVAGPFSDSRNGVWKISSATLNVTTNETDYSYTLAYNANGGSGAPSNQTGSNTGTSPYYTFTVSSTVPTRTGYTFLGWSTSSSATSASYTGGGSITVTSSGTTTLYAVWKANTYTVSYNANGGSGAPAAQTQNYPWHIQIPSTTPTRSGYIFQGWATSSTGAVAYQPEDWYTSLVSVTLYAIWKAAKSTLSSITSEVTVKSNVAGSGTAGWNIVNTAYTYTLVITYSNAPAVTVNVAANTASTSFSIPTTWLSYMPNVNSATATATLTTYASGTSVGSTSLTFTVKVDDSVKPTISSFTHAPYAQNSTVNGWQVYVQGYSQVDLSVSASAGTCASITDITFSGTGITKDTQHPTATTARSAVLTNTGRISGYSVTVTDSRGRSASAEITGDNRPYFYEYSYPAITSITGFRSNSNGDVDSIGGTYIHTSAKFKFSDCGTNHNQLTIQKVEYKLHSASQWTSAVDPATSEQEYTIGGGNINITSSYDVRYTIKDSLLHEATATVLVPPIVGFAVGLNNDRARFGGPVEKAGLQVDWDAEFNGVLDVTKRRCSASLSQEGWHRVCKITTIGRGDYSFAIDLNICRQFYYANNEQHGIKLIANWDSYSFVNENSKSNTQIITKVRYTRDGNDNGYIDIYYDSSLQNDVYCEFAAHGFYPERYTIESLQSVDPSPNGETVLTEYTFSANTYYHENDVTNGVRHIVDRRGDIVTVTIESGGSGINCPAGQYTTVYALSSDLAPAGSVYTVVDTYGGNNIIGGIINTSGEIQIYPVLLSTSYYRFTLTYTI